MTPRPAATRHAPQRPGHHPVRAGSPTGCGPWATASSWSRSSTEGDTSTAPLATLGGTGVFAAALRQALLARRGRPRRALAQGPADRARARAGRSPRSPCARTPATCSSPATALTLGELPAGAVVGTGSPRRVAQLAALGLGPGVRGRSAATSTPGSRLVRDGAVDAVVLARAGLARLGRLDEVTEVARPAADAARPGQGALAVECRADDRRPSTLLARAGRPRHPRLRHRRAGAARRARGRLLGAGRRAGRGRRGRGRRARAVAAGVRRRLDGVVRPAPLRWSARSPTPSASAARSPRCCSRTAPARSRPPIAQPHRRRGDHQTQPRATGDDPLAAPAAEQPTASSPDRPTPERAS